MRIGIIGYGYVGKFMKDLFEEAVLYDVTKERSWASKECVNKCDVVIVCVNTPMSENGSADLSQVHNVLSWLEVPLIILKSTVPPGTTKSLREEYRKHIVFSPEYIGETIAHPMLDLKNRDFWIFGGSKEDTKKAVEFWKQYVTPTARFYQTDAITAEIVKYMENSFYAAKVIFCNEFYEICKAFKRDYNEVRELWLADPRINRNHTQIYENNRGYSGKCLPKDVSAIIHAAKAAGHDPKFLKAMFDYNKELRKE